MNESFTTPSDLFKLARRLGVRLAWVGFKDKIPLKLIPGMGYIVNLQSSDEGNGSHWVCFQISNDGKIAAYFDSFGSEMPIEVEMVLFSQAGLGWVFKNKKIIQNLRSGYCGQYCLMFLSFCQSKAEYPLWATVRAFEKLWSDDPEENLTLLKKRLRNELYSVG